jgi:hypothetical protein
MVAFRIVQPDDALRFIDFPTLVLLFSMMLIVGILHLVGFFEWNAETVLRRLKPSRLLPAVVFTSGVLSAFFVNDLPRDGAVCAEHHAQAAAGTIAVSVGRGDGIEYWQRSEYHGESAEHADRVVLRHPLSRLPPASLSGSGGGFVPRLDGAALDAHAEGEACGRSERRDSIAAARSFTANAESGD